jgi:polysaccharide pyruvyl transferase WcaK-like protein
VSSVPATVFNEIALLPGKLEDFDDDTFFLNFCAANQVLISQMQDSEYVIINGEGTLHGLLPASLALLYTAYIAKTKLGKNTQIINHSGFPRDAMILNPDLADRIYAMVYGALDFVAVREEQSRQELARIGVEAIAGFDCLPLFVKRHPPRSGVPRARVVIAGAVNCDEAYVKLMVRLVDAAHKAGLGVDVLVGANAYLAPDDMRFVNALHPYIQGRYNLVDAQSEAEWLDALAGAKALISGRFHHTIAAACVGTPVLVAASNTEKMSGLLGRLRLDPELVWIAPSDVAGAERKFRNILQSPDIARISDSTLSELHELAARNFDGLKGAAIKSA